MTYIIVKKTASHSAFRPHFNRATDRYYHTKEDYLGDLKKRGLEPYKPGAAEKAVKKTDHKASEWAKDMVRAVHNAPKDKKGRPMLGERWHKSLEKKGVSIRKKPDSSKASGLNTKEGGFTA